MAIILILLYSTNLIMKFNIYLPNNIMPRYDVVRQIDVKAQVCDSYFCQAI